MYKVSAELPDGSAGFTETFKHLRYALKAAKNAVKAGMVVKIGLQELERQSNG